MSMTAESVWNNCLSFIKDNIEPQAYTTWFAPIIPLDLQDNKLQVQVPSQFFYEYLEEHYVMLLKSALTRELGEKSNLVYIIRMENYTEGQKKSITEKIPSSRRENIGNPSVNMPMGGKKDELKNPFVIPGIQKIKIDPQLNYNYNFDTFIEGSSNIIARSAGLAVSVNPGGTAFNPLFIYGGVGLGKTHLAHAIGIGVKEQFPDKKVLFITAEKFTKQFTDSSIRNTTNDFIHFYQLIDVLIVDDIFVLSGKKRTQEVFFHIFNHLHQNNKQVIITSDRAPVDIQDVDQRLISRFKWGLQAELVKPDYNTRLAILKSKLERDGVEMTEEVCQYIAKNVKNNIRELEGVINGIIAHSVFERREITVELAESIIGKSVRKEEQKEITIEDIKRVVANYFNLTVEELQSQSRRGHIVQARHLAMFLTKRFTNLSLASIGKGIGGRNHATVLNSCKQVNNLAETDRRFKQHLDDLIKKLS